MFLYHYFTSIVIANDFFARHIQQRPQQSPSSLGHACGAMNTGATQQVEQQRFGLVVAVMTKKNPVAIKVIQSCIAHLARCGFQPFATGCHMDSAHF